MNVFISHASEDKADFVQPLVEALQNAGIRVWYNTLDMQWGKIDNGIKRSKYAIIVFSKTSSQRNGPNESLTEFLLRKKLWEQLHCQYGTTSLMKKYMNSVR